MRMMIEFIEQADDIDFSDVRLESTRSHRIDIWPTIVRQLDTVENRAARVKEIRKRVQQRIKKYGIY